MLKDILDTRLMVKRAMKRYASKGDEGGGAHQWDVLRRVLDARQLSIKLLANVTYGYTAAGFSGRMPMAELADAIVQVRLTHQTQHLHFIVCCREIERTVNIGVGRAGNQIAS